MSVIVTPRSLLLEYVGALQKEIPCILNGNPDSVHQARVATRRIREVLPLASESNRPQVVEHLQDRFRALGRALGKVRDADVQIVLLRYLESRIPTAAPTLVVVRQGQERRRLRRVRKLIKRLEADELPEMLKTALMRHRLRSWFSRTPSDVWPRLLRSSVAQRAHEAVEAIQRATGVYFPNRTHRARIAIKKFRYALEIGAATHAFSAPDEIRALRKSQDILGDLHDRQELIDELSDDLEDKDAAHKDHVSLVTQVLEAEIHDLYHRFLSRRDRVLAIAAEGNRPAVRRTLPAPPLLLAAGAAAAAYSYRSAAIGSILDARGAGK